MKKLLLASLFLGPFFLLNFLSPGIIKASGEFKTKYRSFYQVQSSTQTLVRQEINLVNQLSQVYATKYSLILQASNPTEVTARNDHGPLENKTFQRDGQTVIDIYFKEPIVGAGKGQDFIVTYSLDEIAQKNGQVWEIKIPKVDNLDQIDEYTLWLTVPDDLGQKAFISPAPMEETHQDKQTVFRFSKNQLGSGIIAILGQMQVFDYLLNYHLENSTNSPTVTQIALPPGTPHQEVFYQDLTPRPDKMEIDLDGNWLATYQLAGKERKNITLQGKAKITAQKRKDFFWPKKINLETNLSEQKYWPVNNFLISSQAQKLKNSREIYNFVVKTLEYDLSQVNENSQRKGALAALNYPKQAICTEFTDLFITLTRAKGIPAREINGYAYTTEAKLKPLGIVVDILHSWAQYWDEGTQEWQSVDPTWAKTTQGVDFFNRLDLNRLVLAIHGQNSQQPAPAGSYKTSSSTGKDVQVTFGAFVDFPEPQIKLEIILDQNLLDSKQKQGRLIVSNHQGVAFYPKTFVVEPAALINLKQKVTNTALPPFSQKEIEFTIEKASNFGWGGKEISFDLDGFKTTTTVKFGFQFQSLVLPMAIFALSVSTGILGLVVIKKRRRKG